MGIKFRCPNGHKLNVKTFLAGKKGICPHCGTRVLIPVGAERDELDDEQADADSLGGTATAVVSAPMKIAAVETPKIEPVVSKSTASTSIKPVPILQPNKPLPVSETAIAAKPVPITAEVPTTPQPVPVPAAPAAVDAIAEAPNAEWYVCPPSGGRFGPAKGEIMRRWLSEGRVSADSLVWRDGWADWQAGAKVFPQLAPSVPVAAEAAPVVTGIAASKTSSAIRSAKSRKKSVGMAVAMVVMLGLICIGLLGAFIFLVLNNAGTA